MADIYRYGKYSIAVENTNFRNADPSFSVVATGYPGFITGYAGYAFNSTAGFYGTGSWEGKPTPFVGVEIRFRIEDNGGRVKAYYNYTTNTYDTYKKECDYDTANVKGTFDEYVYAIDGAYPDDGESGSYWYVKGAVWITDPTGTTTSPAEDIAHSSATLKGAVTDAGTTDSDFYPTVYFEYGETVTDNEVEVSTGGVDDYEKAITGLTPNTAYDFRIKIVNDAATAYGATESFSTTEQPLAMPTVTSPTSGTNTTDTTPTFDFTLTDTPLNTAVKYEARVRISTLVGMASIVYTYESKEASGTWEYLVGAVWTAWPAGGVDPDTRVRLTIADTLEYRQQYYWDCTSYDQSDYGFDLSPAYPLQVIINIDGLFGLTIGGNSYDVFDLIVTETSNGEIGTINFSMNNLGGINYSAIDYGDTVILGINDSAGNTEEFEGRIKSKVPSGGIMSMEATLGDGVLGERLVKEDYDIADITHMWSTSAKNVTTISLAGSGVVENDIVVVCGSGDNVTPSTPTGYTIIASGVSGVGGVYYNISYKRMGSTPDSSVDGLEAADNRPYTVSAFKGVDIATALDVTVTTDSDSSGMPNCPSITPTSISCMILAAGFLDDDEVAATVTAPANFTLSQAYDGTATTVMIAYYLNDGVATAVDPAVFGGGGDDVWVGVTVALRPYKYDVGIILDDVVDTYCSPLTSTGVDTATGFSADIISDNSTPLSVFEELRRRYGFYYFVDSDWDVQVYKSDVIDVADTKITYGG